MSQTTDKPADKPTGTEKAAGEFITLSAAEFQEVLTGYDNAMKTAQATIDQLTADNAAFVQKQASDMANVDEWRKRAAAALVKFKIITPQDEKKAFDQLGNHADALAILSKSVDPTMHAPRPMGQTVKKASAAAGDVPVSRGRANELPEVRAEVDTRFLQDLGIQ